MQTDATYHEMKTSARWGQRRIGRTSFTNERTARLNPSPRIRVQSMRIWVLKDSSGASEVQFQPHALTSVAANDIQPSVAPAPNPAESYLLSLAPGSRRTMNQALNVIAGVIEPASTPAALDWAKVSYAEVAKVRFCACLEVLPQHGKQSSCGPQSFSGHF